MKDLEISITGYLAWSIKTACARSNITSIKTIWVISSLRNLLNLNFNKVCRIVLGFIEDFKSRWSGIKNTKYYKGKSNTKSSTRWKIQIKMKNKKIKKKRREKLDAWDGTTHYFQSWVKSRLVIDWEWFKIWHYFPDEIAKSFSIISFTLEFQNF